METTMDKLVTHILDKMTVEDKKEYEEMKQLYRDIKQGGRIIKWTFSFLLAVGGAYLMLRSIINN